MKRISLILVLFFCNLLLSQKVALVGGTLIDGYGNTPIYDSVILINGAQSGVVIAGGITPKLQSILNESDFELNFAILRYGGYFFGILEAQGYLG